MSAAADGPGDRVLHAYKRLSANNRGAFWLIISALAFTVLTVLIKSLRDYSPPVQVLYAQAVGLMLMVPLVVRTKGKVLVIKNVPTQLARSLFAALGVTLAYYAIQHLPLADANALTFTRALWLAPLSALVLRDRVSPGSWAALVIGFIGVLLVAQPSPTRIVGWAHVAALGSAFFLALSVTGIKLLTRVNSVASIMVWSSILGILLTLPIAAGTWRWPPPDDFLLLILLGVLSAVTTASYIHGMSLGDATKLAVVDYIRLPMAVAVGYFLFREGPNALMLLGGVVIIATAVWSATSDRRNPAEII
jgi:drug/metabolite transporter (DMT)-like permease